VVIPHISREHEPALTAPETDLGPAQMGNEWTPVTANHRRSPLVLAPDLPPQHAASEADRKIAAALDAQVKAERTEPTDDDDGTAGVPARSRYSHVNRTAADPALETIKAQARGSCPWPGPLWRESGRRESNPRDQLGRLGLYH
jgi:hypothetical protein